MRGLACAAQAVEHYEIFRYGPLKAWAAHLGMKDAVDPFDQTVKEEKKTDQLQNQLAERGLNRKAA
ncbi:ferritin-like domain-containing protein [Inquilinus limosus]|uniref:YciE/YciF ferroxidase family protein n=1 Tax=Inquilinus limosus TaxID=171674 RepID=UPI0023B8A535|nr:DUF892 family protein [Inquilinus limosus]